MRRPVYYLSAVLCGLVLIAPASAQEPAETKDYSKSLLVTQMMAFNKKHDGKLTKDEVTDPRLHRLFDMADANKDGVVTKEELTALAAKMYAEDEKQGRGPGRGPDNQDDMGPPGQGGGRGPGRGGMRPGQIMPPFMQERLKLSDDQKKQIQELQKEVEKKLGKILTKEQMRQFQQMGQGPGRGGPGRGPGGDNDDGPPGGRPGNGGGPPGGRRPGGPPQE